MVLAISFVEAPPKFRAPGTTIPLGLGIGRPVFRARAGPGQGDAAGIVTRVPPTSRDVVDHASPTTGGPRRDGPPRPEAPSATARVLRMTEPIRVMVVDDHPMWRDAVERDLQAAGLDVVGVAANGSEALARFPACRPQVLVLDLQIPAPNGVEVTAEVLKQDPSARVLILSASGEQADVLEAVKAGATGYLVKSASREELLDAVRRVAAGDTVFTPGLAGLVLGEFRRLSEPAAADPANPELTERETEVLKMVAKGLSYRQIAERLVLSHRTVQNHVQNTLRKLQMHNRVELTRYAIEQGLDDDADA